MQDQHSNLVYVVALSKDPINKQNNDYTWIDVVEKDKQYYHPVGDYYPTEPVNYIAFRYDGELKSVHHVDSYEIVTNLSRKNQNWMDSKKDHFVYKLGPAMRPVKKMRSGIPYSNRVYCAIDTLLSGECETIKEAKIITERRNSRRNL